MECPICLDEFTELSGPRVFACGHSVCRVCLFSMLAHLELGTSMKCPVCRYQQPRTSLPAENFQLKELLRVLEERERRSMTSGLSDARTSSTHPEQTRRSLGTPGPLVEVTVPEVPVQGMVPQPSTDEIQPPPRPAGPPGLLVVVEIPEVPVRRVVRPPTILNTQPLVLLTLPCEWRVMGQRANYVEGSCTIYTKTVGGRSVKKLRCRAHNGVISSYLRTLVTGDLTTIKFDQRSVNLFEDRRNLLAVLRFSNYSEAKRFQEAANVV